MVASLPSRFSVPTQIGALAENTRPARRFPVATRTRVLDLVSQDRRWGWDGACLETASGVSHDPIAADLNLYRYCGNRPADVTDPSGLVPIQSNRSDFPPVPVPGRGLGGRYNGWKWNPDPRNGRGGSWGPQEPIPGGQGQPSASWDPDDNHWDVDDGHGNRQRYDEKGNPLTEQQAHPNRHFPSPKPLPAPLPVPPKPSEMQCTPKQVVGSCSAGLGLGMMAWGAGGSAIILGDDATIIGVVDDPALVITGGAFVLGGILWVCGY
jgi:hypothetical protein